MSDTWGTVYQMERDKALGQDADSLRKELSATKSVLAATREHVQRLEVQRDEMLKALKVAEAAIDDCQNYRSHLHHKELAQVRETIAAIEARLS